MADANLDPLKKATQFTDDSVGHLLAMTDPLSRTATLGYDADGHTIAATNAAREVTRQTWDARGKLIQLADGAQHTSSRGYDGAGNQIILTNRNGQVWQFQFDGANRLKNHHLTARSRQTVLTWNHQGLLNTVKDPPIRPRLLLLRWQTPIDQPRRQCGHDYLSATTPTTIKRTSPRTAAPTSWTYRRLQPGFQLPGHLWKSDSVSFRCQRKLTNLIYPGRRTVTYFYDSLNRLTNVTDWAEAKPAIAYDLASHVTSITRPNGTYRTMNYDAAGQLTNIWEQMANTLPIAWFRFNWNSNAT